MAKEIIIKERVAMARTWALKCLLCEATPSDLPETGHNDLVRLQEHLMDEHLVSRDDLRRQLREEIDGGYVWRLPDGPLWLEAKAEGGEATN